VKTQRAILAQIGRSEPVTVSALAEALVMDSGALAHTLKPLERDGLLAVAVDPADRSNRLISLTQQGRAKLAETDAWAKAQRCFEAAFGGAESESLREALRFYLPTGTMTNQVGIRAHAGTTDSLLEGEAFETSVPVRDSIFSRTAAEPGETNRPGSQSRILTIDKGRFTVRRARLAPAMISTPGHRASRRRQRGACQPGPEMLSAPSTNLAMLRLAACARQR
jgi:DNA-binding MarR family transcriptional regulator